MIVSEARLAANRRNAQRSTGPRTEEGKQKSRANALKHGLCSSVVVAAYAKLVRPGASLDLDGRVVEAADDPAAVARREIAGLKERRERVEGLDEVNRALAVADLNDEDAPELKRLRRYESALHRRLRWCLAQLRAESPHHRAHPGLTRPRWDAPAVAPSEPIPSPESETPKVVRPAVLPEAP